VPSPKIPLEPPPLPAETDAPPLPPGAPANLQIRWEAPEPLLPEEADLGVEVTPNKYPEATHRLVTIGDSLTHGFKSAAINETQLSWPAIVAKELGWKSFTYPKYPGPADCPGLPLNLEYLARDLEQDIDGKPLPLHALRATASVLKTLHEVKHYWEHGDGTAKPDAADSYNNNLAIYGWDLRDTLDKDLGWCLKSISKRGSLLDLLNPMVSHDGERSAVRALWGPGARRSTTPLSAAQWLGENGGIETLVMALGSNNALASVVKLALRWSEDKYRDLDLKKKYTVWTPDHFRAELDDVVAKVRKISASHVIWLTVPHVTVAPLARGVGTKPPNSRYFTRYTRPWISDAVFDPAFHPSLTGDEARAIDAAIDEYNYAIKTVVHDAREEGLDWLIVDMCGLLDRLAYRRYVEIPAPQPGWFKTKQYKLPAPLAALSPRPETRFFRADTRGRTAGGLVSLDGVHPTTIGYGILAQEVITVMSTKAGVTFLDEKGKPRTGKVKVDFDALIGADTLISNPPKLLDEATNAIGLINTVVDVAATMLGKRGP
jgi:hypothetical protein